MMVLTFSIVSKSRRSLRRSSLGFAIDVLVFVVVGLVLASEFVNLSAIVLGGRHVGRFGGGGVVVGCFASVFVVIGIGIYTDLLNLVLI